MAGSQDCGSGDDEIAVHAQGYVTTSLADSWRRCPAVPGSRRRTPLELLVEAAGATIPRTPRRPASRSEGGACGHGR